MGSTTSIKARRCEEWFFSDNLVVVVEVTADVHRGNTATLANAAVNGLANGLATGSAFTSKNPKAATAATSRNRASHDKKFLLSRAIMDYLKTHEFISNRTVLFVKVLIKPD
ncbi:hypothetical protein V1477_014947 [Vespula maculifrons]|uniref:Uncharacterized protein n=1 Tax=Vespula maculifrons TaxID=7453 RepID=A0ABD2BIW9_VESMC